MVHKTLDECIAEAQAQLKQCLEAVESFKSDARYFADTDLEASRKSRGWAAHYQQLAASWRENLKNRYAEKRAQR